MCVCKFTVYKRGLKVLRYIRTIRVSVQSASRRLSLTQLTEDIGRLLGVVQRHNIYGDIPNDRIKHLRS